MLYKFVYGYTADYTAKIRSIALYTDTRCVTALHSYTATIQLYIIQLYSATLYNLYNPPLAQQAGLGLPTRPEEQLNTRPLQGGIWMVSAGSRGTRAAPLASHSLAPQPEFR